MELTFDRKNPDKFFTDNPVFDPSEHSLILITDIIEEKVGFTVFSHLGSAVNHCNRQDIEDGTLTIIRARGNEFFLYCLDEDSDATILAVKPESLALIIRITGLSEDQIFKVRTEKTSTSP